MMFFWIPRSSRSTGRAVCRGCVPARVGSPVGHEGTALLEEVGPSVSGFDTIAVDVGQGEFAHLTIQFGDLFELAI